MEFLKNISINIKATGPSAVLITWIMSLTLLGIFGGDSSRIVIGILSSFGIVYIGAMAQKKE